MSKIFLCCLILCVMGATLGAPADEKDRDKSKGNSHPAAHGAHVAVAPVPQTLPGKTRAARDTPPKPETAPVTLTQQHPKPLTLPTVKSNNPPQHH